MKATKVNLVSLCDIDTILGLPSTLPMLESINTSMKFVHAKDVSCVITLQLFKFTKLIHTKFTMVHTFHFNLKTFLSSWMLLQTHLAGLPKIG
jgi:hypothetical protein